VSVVVVVVVAVLLLPDIEAVGASGLRYASAKRATWLTFFNREPMAVVPSVGRELWAQPTFRSEGGQPTHPLQFSAQLSRPWWQCSCTPPQWRRDNFGWSTTSLICIRIICACTSRVKQNGKDRDAHAVVQRMQLIPMTISVQHGKFSACPETWRTLYVHA
jgi:hypothetical protein